MRISFLLLFLGGLVACESNERFHLSSLPMEFEASQSLRHYFTLIEYFNHNESEKVVIFKHNTSFRLPDGYEFVGDFFSVVSKVDPAVRVIHARKLDRPTMTMLNQKLTAAISQKWSFTMSLDTVEGSATFSAVSQSVHHQNNGWLTDPSIARQEEIILRIINPTLNYHVNIYSIGNVLSVYRVAEKERELVRSVEGFDYADVLHLSDSTVSLELFGSTRIDTIVLVLR